MERRDGTGGVMKKLTVVLAGLALMAGFAAPAAAQRADTTGRMRGRGMGRAGADVPALVKRRMLRGITLTHAQRAQVTKLRDARRARVQAFGANRTRVAQRASRAGRAMRVERMQMRRRAMVRAFAPRHGGMMMRGRGFRPGSGTRARPGRGGFGPGMQRGRGGPPPDSTGTPGN
jgi:Spy/CpxP family protein refolding chaperone